MTKLAKAICGFGGGDDYAHQNCPDCQACGGPSYQTYGFETLDPRPGEAAKNERFFLHPVFGIEVSIPALASRCIGNIDPQHTDGNAELAAIEVALICALPEEGTILATVRADLDSVGAMAIISLRFEGVDLSVAMERIALVAAADKFARGIWPGVRPLPTEEKLFDDSSASVESDVRLAPMQMSVSDFNLSLETRVERMKRWLLTGKEPLELREKFIAERQALASAIINGQINAKSDGQIAQVVSTHRAATQVGYCLAPVVVALNPKFSFGGGEPHAKFTICQFTGEHVNLKAVFAELSEIEPGWGGSPTIGGSPQGVNSVLTIEQVVGVVKKHLK